MKYMVWNDVIWNIKNVIWNDTNFKRILAKATLEWTFGLQGSLITEQQVTVDTNIALCAQLPCSKVLLKHCQKIEKIWDLLLLKFTLC